MAPRSGFSIVKTLEFSNPGPYSPIFNGKGYSVQAKSIGPAVGNSQINTVFYDKVLFPDGVDQLISIAGSSNGLDVTDVIYTFNQINNNMIVYNKTNTPSSSAETVVLTFKTTPQATISNIFGTLNTSEIELEFGTTEVPETYVPGAFIDIFQSTDYSTQKNDGSKPLPPVKIVHVDGDKLGLKGEWAGFVPSANNNTSGYTTLASSGFVISDVPDGLAPFDHIDIYFQTPSQVEITHDGGITWFPIGNNENLDGNIFKSVPVKTGDLFNIRFVVGQSGPVKLYLLQEE